MQTGTKSKEDEYSWCEQEKHARKATTEKARRGEYEDDENDENDHTTDECGEVDCVCCLDVIEEIFDVKAKATRAPNRPGGSD